MTDTVEYWREREEAEEQDRLNNMAESQLDEFISNYGGEE